MKTKIIAAVGILLILASVLVYLEPWEEDTNGDDIDWQLNITGPNGAQEILSYDEIKHLPAYEGFGGYFTTTGLIYGPYEVKGVLLTDLCDLVGGVTPEDVVFVSAIDGYSSVYDYDRVLGNFDTYDPDTMEVVSHGESRLVLMYEQNGKPLSYDDGQPLRIARIGPDDKLLIEGQYWVKWVDGIEVEKLEE
ncbi:MAG: molybdopterin-dependent oxidoreductase [Dehalococcoidia bacterium]|nr:molybdopterin-dependent oxidoreductase [Dehalococcoidia bacterium]